MSLSGFPASRFCRLRRFLLIPAVLSVFVSAFISATCFAEDAAAVAESKPEEATATAAESESETKPDISQQAAEKLLEQTNEYRKQLGHKPLVLNEKLSLACENLADTMIKTGQFSHHAGGTSPSQRAKAAGYQGGWIAENLFYRGTPADNFPQQMATSTFNAWKNSSGHHQNMINSRYTECGIAIKQDPRSGRTYSVMLYAAP